jgi:hypothetical protein
MSDLTPPMASTDPTKAALLAALRTQRQHVLGALEGLDSAALHRPVLPSGWSCLGLVQHLALDVERWWFRLCMLGESVADEWTAAMESGGWTVDPRLAPAAVLDLYRDEIQRADVVIARTALDAAPAAWPGDPSDDWQLPDLRTTMLHVITETACHAGHLDAARELLDGQTWLILS